MIFVYGPSTKGLSENQLAALRRAAIYEINLDKYSGRTIQEVRLDVAGKTIKIVIVVAKEEVCYSDGNKDSTGSDPLSSSTLCNRLSNYLRRSVLCKSFILIITVELLAYHWRVRSKSKV